MSSMSSSLLDTIVLIRVLSSVPARWAEEHSQHLQMGSCEHVLKSAAATHAAAFVFPGALHRFQRFEVHVYHTLVNQNKILEEACCHSHKTHVYIHDTMLPLKHLKFIINASPGLKAPPWRPKILLLCTPRQSSPIYISLLMLWVINHHCFTKHMQFCHSPS